MFVALFIFLVSVTQVPAQVPQESLASLSEKLRLKPDDTALREQIIKLASEMKPRPAIPESARENFVQGMTLFKSAKDAAGQKLAAESFAEALRIAPWWGDTYYNLSLVQELAGQLDAAEISLKFYILAAPGETEARKAQDKIYEIRAKKKLVDTEAKEKADKEAQQRAAALAAEQAKKDEEARKQRLAASLNWLQGTWYAKYCNWNPNVHAHSCTDAQRKGTNWYDVLEPTFDSSGRGSGARPAPMTFDLRNDGTVKFPASFFAGCRDEGEIIGTPYGTNVWEIRWEFRPKNGGLSRQIWAYTWDDGKRIRASCDRPVSDSSYDPARGYAYVDIYRK
ncbi:MAG: hypothetical protein ABL952_02060 [Pyrinomonadaceae bacterium]